jgi:hypothetical protein
MRFAIVGEGLTDFKVLKNLLIGFFKDKNLPITRLLPVDKEPVGWGNVFQFLTTNEFQKGVGFADYTLIQVDTNECADWNVGLAHIGDDVEAVNEFIDKIAKILIAKMGNEFYEANKNKIIFAICVHEIECWLLPFNAEQVAHHAKMIGCANAIERIAQKNGYSIHQKNYQEGKHYDDLSKEMKSNKDLLKKGSINPSLKYFLDSLGQIPQVTPTED